MCPQAADAEELELFGSEEEAVLPVARVRGIRRMLRSYILQAEKGAKELFGEDDEGRHEASVVRAL